VGSTGSAGSRTPAARAPPSTRHVSPLCCVLELHTKQTVSIAVWTKGGSGQHKERGLQGRTARLAALQTRRHHARLEGAAGASQTIGAVGSRKETLPTARAVWRRAASEARRSGGADPAGAALYEEGIWRARSAPCKILRLQRPDPVRRTLRMPRPPRKTMGCIRGGSAGGEGGARAGAFC
jgi:hypothetical protein